MHEDNVVHQYIICDGTKIREIMINLVSNAIKYTPDDGTVSHDNHRTSVQRRRICKY